jgi:hypothetical protein
VPPPPAPAVATYWIGSSKSKHQSIHRHSVRIPMHGIAHSDTQRHTQRHRETDTHREKREKDLQASHQGPDGGTQGRVESGAVEGGVAEGEAGKLARVGVGVLRTADDGCQQPVRLQGFVEVVCAVEGKGERPRAEAGGYWARGCRVAGGCWARGCRV